MRKIVLLLAFVICVPLYFISCNEKEEDTQDVYYIVTHGPTTDVGFWGTVLDAAQKSATEKNVKLIPLHPVTETTGQLLNEKMQEAIDAKPTGIVATLWGDGMDDIVKQANEANIPIAAINVYPDDKNFVGNSTTAKDGKAGFLFYAGQEDQDAARKVIMALIQYATDGTKWRGDEADNIACGGDWKSCIDALNIKEVVIFDHQSAGGTIPRNLAIKEFLTQNNCEHLYKSIDIATGGVDDKVQVIKNYFGTVANGEKVLIIFFGEVGVTPYKSFLTDATAEDKAKVLAASSFDIGGNISYLIKSGDLVFGVNQQENLQGKYGLEILINYKEKNVLPSASELDSRWFPDSNPFPWYKTGPAFQYKEDL